MKESCGCVVTVDKDQFEHVTPCRQHDTMKRFQDAAMAKLKKPVNFKEDLEKILKGYDISYKNGIQCKCITGAKGHLLAKLVALHEKSLEETRLIKCEEPLRHDNYYGKARKEGWNEAVDKQAKLIEQETK